jgi:hypothetical protein
LKQYEARAIVGIAAIASIVAIFVYFYFAKTNPFESLIQSFKTQAAQSQEQQYVAKAQSGQITNISQVPIQDRVAVLAATGGSGEITTNLAGNGPPTSPKDTAVTTVVNGTVYSASNQGVNIETNPLASAYRRARLQ